MFCDILTPERTPYEGDPRHVLRRAVERAEPMGFDHFYVGPELEYFYFRDSKSTEVLDEGGYFDLTTLDAGSDLRRETVLALEQLGIHTEYTHHEVGPSQHEIDMRYADAMKMADDCMTYRITVKEYAMKYGLHATFMPKPLFGKNGSGMHTHQSLFRGEQQRVLRRRRSRTSSPMSARPSSPASCATRGRSARSSPNGSTPTSAWCPATRHRSTSPGHGATARRWSGSRCTTRAASARRGWSCAVPIPPCNPYLTFAVLLQAGLEGIEHGYELPDPMEKNLYHLSPGRAAAARASTSCPRPSARRSS